ncbi:hypothetical protein BEH94_02535 [Candidatus Altiarchaeales archaeon WOR_SM1_SCG]|nr:hypothetical protein BEH94_02535 [Candidatus Altiarchaeales archaeon WOR_SM1_SCG]
MNKEFESVSNIKSNLAFPTSISELFQRLIIDTKLGEFDVPLRLRGDGIQMRYIPTILNYIARESKFYPIWGFDEPENSCEYRLAKELADDFSTTFLKHSQIFVSTHAFNFISLEGGKITGYRVFKDEEDINTKILPIDDKNRGLLEDDVGALLLNKKFAELHEKSLKENDANKKIIDDLKRELENKEKPVIMLEGPSDKILFEAAYHALFDKSIYEDYILNNHLTSTDGSIGSGAYLMNQYLYNHICKVPSENTIIGIFDFDKKGYDEFQDIGKRNVFDNKEEIFRFKNVINRKDLKNVFAITIVPPDHRSTFYDLDNSDYCYISTELLLQDKEIPKANRKLPAPHYDKVFSFKGKKTSFAKKIEKKCSEGKEIDFSGFLKTFELIRNIVSKQSK